MGWGEVRYRGGGEGGGGVRHSGVEWSIKLVHTEKLEHFYRRAWRQRGTYSCTIQRQLQ